MANQQFMVGGVAPLVVSISSSTNNQSGTGSGIITTATPSTCVVSGGSGSYSYQWTPVSGSTAVNISGSSTSSTCIFLIAGQPVGAYARVYKCTVTDTVTGEVVDSSNNVTVTITRTS